MQRENQDPRPAPETDTLGGLIRAAGRRVAPPAEHYASVRAASRDAWRAKVSARGRRRVRYALAASVVVAAGAIGALSLLEPASVAAIAEPVRIRGDVSAFSVQTGLWRPLTPGAAGLGPGDRVRTGPRGGAAFDLVGGVSLRIGADTELTLAQADALALDTGTIYLDSGDDARREPLEIATPHGTVSDIGTQFEVVSRSEALRVRVRDGVIRLRAADVAADTSAGQEIELTAGGGLERRPFAPHDAGWDWVQALAVAPDGDASIREYLRWISKETGRPLRYDSMATEARAELEHFRGDPRGLMPLELLESITATTDFEHVLETDGAILIVRRTTVR